MRTSSTVQIHGLGACYWHIKRAHLRLSVLKRDVATMHAIFHRCAGFIGCGLGDCVVAVGELELHNVADGRGDGVWDECILGSPHDYGDNLAGAAEGVT